MQDIQLSNFILKLPKYVTIAGILEHSISRWTVWGTSKLTHFRQISPQDPVHHSVQTAVLGLKHFEIHPQTVLVFHCVNIWQPYAILWFITDQRMHSICERASKMIEKQDNTVRVGTLNCSCKGRQGAIQRSFHKGLIKKLFYWDKILIMRMEHAGNCSKLQLLFHNWSSFCPRSISCDTHILQKYLPILWLHISF